MRTNKAAHTRQISAGISLFRMTTRLMNQPPLTTTGLEMPVDFPREPYEAAFSLVAPFAEYQQFAWEEFAGAWNAISYRFMASCEYGESLQNLGRTDLMPMDRNEEEKRLFGFFVSAYATFEAAIYGTFAIGSLSDPRAFSIKTEQDRKRITASTLLNALKTFNAPIAERIEDILKSAPYAELKKTSDSPRDCTDTRLSPRGVKLGRNTQPYNEDFLRECSAADAAVALLRARTVVTNRAP